MNPPRNSRKMVSAVIVAAGGGVRYGGEKQFEPLEGKTVLWHSVDPFMREAAVEHVVVVLPERFIGRSPVDPGLHTSDKLIVVSGGARRQDSVYNGLMALPAGCETVLIHDGVRPLLGRKLLRRIIDEALQGKTIVPVIPESDTVKEVENGEVVRTLERGCLYRVQTPQAFPVEILLEAHRQAEAGGVTSTDDAQMVEALGVRVDTIPGERDNLKITCSDDLEMASFLLGRRGA